MPSVYLLFGSNLGNRVTNIRQAILSLVDDDLKLLQVSHFYETEAWGEVDQPNFLNVCSKYKSTLEPEQLLKKLQQVEQQIGRKQRNKWMEREIDIDILFYGKVKINDDDLTIPHKLLFKRNFALQPLIEIAPNKKHPKFKLTVKELALLCTDEKQVLKLKFKPKL